MNEEPLPQASLRRASYELFVFALSFIALFNTVLIELEIVSPLNAQVLRIINYVLALFFLADFFLRILRADNKADYFFRGFGWADLLSGIPHPAFQIFRLFRLGHSAMVLRRLGGRRVLKELNRNRAGGALYFAIVLAVVLIQFASTSIVRVEASNPAANIKTASDAIWWAYVTITTVGYGDYYPVTNTGRIIGVMVMTIGVGLFGVLSGFLANAFLGNPHANDDNDDDEPVGLAKEMGDSLTQLSDLQALLTQQEENLAALRSHMEAMEAQMRSTGMLTAASATSQSDAALPK